MRVQCIDNEDAWSGEEWTHKRITLMKIYEVFDTGKIPGKLGIIGNDGHKCWFYADRFLILNDEGET